MEDQKKIDQNVLVTKIIYLAMVGGLTLFLFVALFVGLTTSQPLANSPNATNVSLYLLMALIVLFPGCIIGSRIAFSEMIKKGKKGPSETLKTAMIVRITILEGSALFGLAGCLVAGINDTFYSSPILWLLLVPYVYFVFMIKNTFPTKKLFEEFSRTI